MGAAGRFPSSLGLTDFFGDGVGKAGQDLTQMHDDPPSSARFHSEGTRRALKSKLAASVCEHALRQI